MKKNKIFCVFTAAVMALSLLCCCTPAEEKPQETTGYDVAYDVTLGAEKGFEISPLLFGEFKESLAGSIYGVIWSELIQDRKFYYPAGEEGLSPWKTSGDVTNSEECYSLNGYAAVLSANASLSQEIEFGVKRYDGYFYAEGTGTVRADVGGDVSEISVNGAFKKYIFSAVSDAESARDVVFTCTEGEVKLDSLSLMPADNYKGMRKDTLDVMKDLGGTIYRWPGGNLVSGYDWKDGVGDRDRRVCRRNAAWFPDTGDIEYDKQRLAGGLGDKGDFYAFIEPFDLGTDEFLAMCDYIGALPDMAVNTGNGTVQMAADLVEYCNGGVDTVYGALRAANGHAEPYNIKYWCVGNEMQGDWQIGHVPLSVYTARHNEFADAMRAVDDSILLTGCGDNASSWSEGMLEECGGRMDFIGEHLYVPMYNDYALITYLTLVHDSFRDRIAAHRELTEKYPDAAHVDVAFDEYALSIPGPANMRYALGMAEILNLFIENADVVKIAAFTQGTYDLRRSNPSAAVFTLTNLAVLSPPGYVLQAYTKYMQQYTLDVNVRQTDRTTNLRWQGSVSADGKTVAVAVSNPSDKRVKLNVSGVATHVAVVGADEKATTATAADGWTGGVTRTVTNDPSEVVLAPLSVNVVVLRIG